MTTDDLAALRTSLVLIANECVQPTDQHTIPRIQSLAHDALAGVRVAPSPDAPPALASAIREVLVAWERYFDGETDEARRAYWAPLARAMDELNAQGFALAVAPSPDAPPRSYWMEFIEWESAAAAQGSGMTQDQMTGAAMFRSWLVNHAPDDGRPERVAPSPDALGLREADEAVDEAQKALVAAIEKRTWQAAAGPIVPGGAEVNEAIRNFRAAIERAAIPPRDALDVEREAVVEAIERDGVVTWGDDGHRERFLAMLPVHLARIAREYAALDREPWREASRRLIANGDDDEGSAA